MRDLIDLVGNVRLDEAPLANASAHGTPLDQDGSFSKIDGRYFQANLLKGVYKEKLARLPFDLYLYVLNHEGLEELAADYVMGEVNWNSSPPEVDSVFRNKPVVMPPLEQLREVVSSNSDGNSVQLILGNNWSDGGWTITLTPWMIVHRLLHTIDYEFFSLAHFGPSNDTAAKAKLVWWRADHRMSWWDVPMMKSVLSGDPAAFDNDNELCLEMGVEYLVRGDIRINEEKIKAKCEKLGLNFQKYMKIISERLNRFKAAMDQQVASMRGTTRYI